MKKNFEKVLFPFKMKPDFKISEFSLRQNFCSPGTSSSAFSRDGEYHYVSKTFAVSYSLGMNRILKDHRMY